MIYEKVQILLKRTKALVAHGGECSYWLYTLFYDLAFWGMFFDTENP